MADSAGFTHLVPGFDFLQGLVKNAGAAIPSIGQWVAPTLDPDELAKRIEELRTVQFWLEQNARMISATIQALEVQRMTLSTLRTMNVQMEDLRDSMKIRLPVLDDEAPEPPAAPAPAVSPFTGRAFGSAASSAGDEDDEDEEKEAGSPAADEPAEGAAGAAEPASAGAGAPGMVDPMKWWSALTHQFTELAASAIKDGAAEAARNFAAAQTAAQSATTAVTQAATQAAAKVAARAATVGTPAAKAAADDAPAKRPARKAVAGAPAKKKAGGSRAAAAKRGSRAAKPAAKN